MISDSEAALLKRTETESAFLELQSRLKIEEENSFVISQQITTLNSQLENLETEESIEIKVTRY